MNINYIGEKYFNICPYCDKNLKSLPRVDGTNIKFCDRENCKNDGIYRKLEIIHDKENLIYFGIRIKNHSIRIDKNKMKIIEYTRRFFSISDTIEIINLELDEDFRLNFDDIINQCNNILERILGLKEFC
jgi:hypothetical protein